MFRSKNNTGTVVVATIAIVSAYPALTLAANTAADLALRIRRGDCGRYCLGRRCFGRRTSRGIVP